MCVVDQRSQQIPLLIFCAAMNDVSEKKNRQNETWNQVVLDGFGIKKNKGTKHRTKLSPFFWLNELLGEPKKSPSCNSISCYTKKPDVTATICSRIVLKILRKRTRSQISPKTKVLPGFLVFQVICGFLVFQVFFAGFPFSHLWLKHPFEKYARQNGNLPQGSG